MRCDAITGSDLTSCRLPTDILFVMALPCYAHFYIGTTIFLVNNGHVN